MELPFRSRRQLFLFLLRGYSLHEGKSLTIELTHQCRQPLHEELRRASVVLMESQAILSGNPCSEESKSLNSSRKVRMVNAITALAETAFAGFLHMNRRSVLGLRVDDPSRKVTKGRNLEH